MESAEPEANRFRILSIDGGGIRGIAAARIVAELEARISAAAGEERRIADCFHLLAGTSTGGLIALGLTAPDPEAPGRPRMSGNDLAAMYRERGPEIFPTRLRFLRSLRAWIRPKYPLDRLRRVLEDELGGAPLSEALRDLVVTAYDVRRREVRLFKRWRARQDPERDHLLVDAGLATAAAPTFFPAHPLVEGSDGAGASVERLLVDGGVFASNPTVAAVVEALKRRSDEPASLRPSELLVVSLGTGHHEVAYPQARRWGRLGWILPRSGESPLLSTMFDGQSDAADHWAHILLNHEPGTAVPAAEGIGRGPRYHRFQIDLPPGFAMDDARPDRLKALEAAAERLIEERGEEIDRIAATLAGLDRPAGDRR